MKRPSLAAAVLLTLTMGLTIGCADTKKQNERAKETTANANKQIDQMNADSRTLNYKYDIDVMTGYFSASKIRGMTKTQLTEALSLLDNVSANGTDASNLIKNKGVSHSDPGSITTAVASAQNIRVVVMKELEKR